MSGLLDQWNEGRLEVIVSTVTYEKNIVKLKNDYVECFSETTGI